MRIEVEPRRLTMTPGEPQQVSVLVTNTGDVISGYSMRFLGADPAWVSVDQSEPSLFPGESVVVTARVDLPMGIPAGERRMAVQVRELAGEQGSVIEDLVVDIPGAPAIDVDLDPSTVTAGRRAEYDVLVRNNGNTVLDAVLVGSDEEHRLGYAFSPPRLHLAPGQDVTVELTIGAKRQMFGSPAPRAFELRVDERPGRARNGNRATRKRTPKPPPKPKRRQSPEQKAAETAARAAAIPDTPPAAMGVFLQKPFFSRGVLAMTGLLAAITVFAIVITTALGSVVSRSSADRDLALQVAQAQEASATSGTSAISGEVRLISTGEPLAGVSVEAFEESDTDAALATTASEDSGAWAFTDLPAGEFKLRFRGAGFDEVWYPAAATDAEAVAVEIGAGEQVDDLAVLLGGVPATVSGTVEGEDVGGAVATLELPLDSPALAGQVPPEEATAEEDGRVPGAVVRTEPVGADGEFELEQIPSPAVYDLVISKPGFSEQVQRVDLAAGEDRTDLVTTLLDGDGSISGTVTGSDGPVGGATIAATFGETTVRTVSLTEDEVGAFTLRGLPTPGAFTLVISAPDHAPATLSLDLTPGQQLTGVAASLGAAAGSLGGTVSAPGGGDDVTVTVSDGAETRQTVTRSTDPVGEWMIDGLRIPSTYQVTFTRSDLESQTVSVNVDGYGNVTAGASSASGVDVEMRRATATIEGTVSQRDAAGDVRPAGNVEVTASSGTSEFAVTTASSGDPGAFVLDGLPPGTYTVTFSRSGTEPTSEIVNLEVAQTHTMEPVLVAPASIQGQVTSPQGDGSGGLTVRLFDAEAYGTAASPVATTTTSSSGHYEFEDVDAPAHYIVEVLRGSTTVATSAPVTLTASEEGNVNLTESEQDQGSSDSGAGS